MNRAM